MNGENSYVKKSFMKLFETDWKIISSILDKRYKLVFMHVLLVTGISKEAYIFRV